LQNKIDDAMHTTNYVDTLILPSPDSKAEQASTPEKPGSVAAQQFARLVAAPFGMTSDDLLFDVHAERNGVGEGDRDAARAAYFSKGQACLRASPLVKTMGWALHHDGHGRVGLVDPASAEFEALMARDDVTKLAGMRSKRG